MANKDEITTKFRVDISDLKKGITEANKQIKLANAEFKAASAGMTDWSKSSDGIKAKLDQLSSVLAAQNAKLEAYTKEQQRMEEAARENGKRADELRNKLKELADKGVSKTSEEYKKYEKALNDTEKEQEQNKTAADNLRVTILNQQAAVNNTKKDISTYTDELKNLESGAKSADDDVDELTDSVKEAGNQAEKSADGFTIMGGAIASLVADGIRKAIDAVKEFVTESVKAHAEFDKMMSNVKAISNATDQEVELLRNKAYEIGKDSQYTAGEIAEMYSYMGMEGWKPDQMIAAANGISNLAAATGTALGSTSDIVTDAITAFGDGADDANHYADVFAATATNSNTSVELLGESFKYCGAVAGAAGSSIEDVAIAIGLMANSGIKGSVSSPSEVHESFLKQNSAAYKLALLSAK